AIVIDQARLADGISRSAVVGFVQHMIGAQDEETAAAGYQGAEGSGAAGRGVTAGSGIRRVAARGSQSYWGSFALMVIIREHHSEHGARALGGIGLRGSGYGNLVRRRKTAGSHEHHRISVGLQRADGGILAPGYVDNASCRTRRSQ